jgi:septum formation protein
VNGALLAREAIVLASASVSRRRVLEAAGVAIEIDPAAIDEEEIKRSVRADGGSAAECAEMLAAAKALRVSGRRSGQLVLGADQVLLRNGQLFDKPGNREEARAHLRALAGGRHRLISAAAVAFNGALIWQHRDEAELTMRSLSEGFIETYLELGGDALLASVGVYQLEGLGAQLFERVDGDFFTVLGLPLMPVLAFLRDRGVLMR